MSKILHGRWYFSISPIVIAIAISPSMPSTTATTTICLMCRRCKQFCLLKIFWIGFDKRHKMRAPAHFTLKNCSRHIYRQQPYAKCETNISIKCCCVLQLFYFANVWASMYVCSSLCFFPILSKHNNIILTHSKHIKMKTHAE